MFCPGVHTQPVSCDIACCGDTFSHPPTTAVAAVTIDPVPPLLLRSSQYSVPLLHGTCTDLGRAAAVDSHELHEKWGWTTADPLYWPYKIMGVFSTKNTNALSSARMLQTCLNNAEVRTHMGRFRFRLARQSKFPQARRVDGGRPRHWQERCTRTDSHDIVPVLFLWHATEEAAVQPALVLLPGSFLDMEGWYPFERLLLTPSSVERVCAESISLFVQEEYTRSSRVGRCNGHPYFSLASFRRPDTLRVFAPPPRSALSGTTKGRSATSSSRSSSGSAPTSGSCPADSSER